LEGRSETDPAKTIGQLFTWYRRLPRKRLPTAGASKANIGVERSSTNLLSASPALDRFGLPKILRDHEVLPARLDDQWELRRNPLEDLGHLRDRHLEKLSVIPQAVIRQKVVGEPLGLVPIADVDVVDEAKTLRNARRSAKLIGPLRGEASRFPNLQKAIAKSGVAECIQPAGALVPLLSAVEIINENLGGLEVSVQELVEAFVVGRHEADSISRGFDCVLSNALSEMAAASQRDVTRRNIA